MITTNDPEIYRRLLKLRWVGISKDTWSREEKDSMQYSWNYDVEELGYKYHMNDITAALGLVQLEKLDMMNQTRFQISQRYTEAFSSISHVEIPKIKDYMTKPACHNYVIKLNNRDEMNDYLKQKGISSGVHYIPNNHYDMYRRYRGETPISDNIWKKILTLPLYPDLKSEQVEYIINSIREFIS